MGGAAVGLPGGCPPPGGLAGKGGCLGGLRGKMAAWGTLGSPLGALWEPSGSQRAISGSIGLPPWPNRPVSTVHKALIRPKGLKGPKGACGCPPGGLPGGLGV